MMNPDDRANYNFQKLIFVVATLLFLIKLAAWYITSSVAILTDTLESITNMLAGAFTIFSLYLSAKPKDHNHLLQPFESYLVHIDQEPESLSLDLSS